MEIVAKIGEIVTKIVAICILLSMIITLLDLYFTYMSYLKTKFAVKEAEMINRVNALNTVKKDAISEIVKFQLNNKNNKK